MGKFTMGLFWRVERGGELDAGLTGFTDWWGRDVVKEMTTDGEIHDGVVPAGREG